MQTKRVLSLQDFAWLGRDQWYVQKGVLARSFLWLLGPLGLHARIRNAHTIRTLASQCPLEGTSILDAGCGHGYTLFWLARNCKCCRLYGIDLDQGLIEMNRQVAESLGVTHLQFSHGDARDIGGRKYDVIFSIDLLEHINDDQGALRSWRNGLVDEGLLVLHLPLRHQTQRRVFSWFRHHLIPDHVRDEYTEADIINKLHLTGFRVERISYGFGTAGELAFELNYLFWDHPMLRVVAALVTYPFALLLGYWDVMHPPGQGNSLLVVARKA